MSTENISLYYYSENGEVVGPYTIQELSGRITPDSLVVSENATKWIKASEVTEIADILFVPEPPEAEMPSPEELEVDIDIEDDDSSLEDETEEFENETISHDISEKLKFVHCELKNINFILLLYGFSYLYKIY